MGMVLAIMAMVVAVGGAIAGGFLGLLVGFMVASQRRRRSGGSGTVVMYAFLGATFGAIVSCAGGFYVGYKSLNSDGPPHGYADRQTYRDAEMASRAKELDLLIAALTKYKADRGRYPAELKELIGTGYLEALPGEARMTDHLGQPNRIALSSTTNWYGYFVSDDGQRAALGFGIGFNEDRRMMGHHRENRMFDLNNPGWRSGSPDGIPLSGSRSTAGTGRDTGQR